MDAITAKTILQKIKKNFWFGFDYNMNLYKGCCHGCIYCDSRSDCYGVENFDRVRYKENALSILRRELTGKPSGVIGTGSMSDLYNPFEKELMLTRKSLELINDYRFGCGVLSKSALISRDIDIFTQIKNHSPMLCSMTITAADDRLCRLIEPYVSSSSERFSAVSQMSQAGLFTGIVMTPVLPFIEDTEENIIKMVKFGHEAGVQFIYADMGMTLRHGQREYYLNKLDRIFPDSGLSEKYTAYYGDRYDCPCPDGARLWKIFTDECEKYNIIYKMTDITAAYKKPYEYSQLTFC